MIDAYCDEYDDARLTTLLRVLSPDGGDCDDDRDDAAKGDGASGDDSAAVPVGGCSANGLRAP